MFNVEEAKKAGYSEQEIADYLASQRNFDAAGARSSGYTDAEIIGHLTAPVVKETLTVPAQMQGSGGMIQPAPRQQERPLDPTSGMGEGEKFAAGVGKAVVDAGRGAQQLGKEILHYSRLNYDPQGVAQQRAAIDESRRLDRALMNTGAGMVGDISGNITMSLLPGLGARALGQVANAPSLVNAGTSYLAPKTLLGSFGIGASQSLLQPVGENESRVLNAGVGGEISLGANLLGRGISSLYQGGKALVRPFTEKGREYIAGDVLNRYAGNKASAIANMKRPAELVKGSLPTMAEMADDPGISQLQRTLQNLPQTNSAITNRMVENNAARVKAIKDIAQNEAALNQAMIKRTEAITPYRKIISSSDAEIVPSRAVTYIDRVLKSATGQRSPIVNEISNVRKKLLLNYPLEDRAKDAIILTKQAIENPAKGAESYIKNINKLNGMKKILNSLSNYDIDESQAIKQIKGLGITIKSHKEVQSDVLKTLRANNKYETSPEQLYGIRTHISDLLNAKNPDGSRTYSALSRELTAIQKMIDRSIYKTVPEYRTYLKEYERLSRPVNQMVIGNKILQGSASRLEKSGGEVSLYPEQYARTLDNIRGLVSSATGYKRTAGLSDIFDPQQVSVLNNIRADLARAEAGKNLGRAVGSNTRQNFASDNFLRNILGPIGAPESIVDGGVLKKISAPLHIVEKFTSDDLNAVLAEAAVNPKYAAQLMEQAPELKRLLSPYTRTLLTHGPLGAYNQ